LAKVGWQLMCAKTALNQCQANNLQQPANTNNQTTNNQMAARGKEQETDK